MATRRILFRFFNPPAIGDDATVSGDVAVRAFAAAPLRVGLYGVGGIGFAAGAAGTVAPIRAYVGRSELESAYLPLNGSTQYGYAANALAGITAADTWTTAVKLHDLAAIANGTYGAWLYAYDATVTPINSLHNRVWTLVQYYQGGAYVGKATAAGSVIINSLFPGASALGVPKVLAITQSPGNVNLRIITAAGIEYEVDYPYAAGAPNDRDPLHLAMGGQLNESHAIMVPSQMGTAKNIGVLVAMGETPTAELLGWLMSYDAREHISDLRNYWPLAAAVGSTVPDVVGGSDMTLVAITASSLVQTATPEGGIAVPVAAAVDNELVASAAVSGSGRVDASTAAVLSVAGEGVGAIVVDAYAGATSEAGSSTSGAVAPHGTARGNTRDIIAGGSDIAPESVAAGAVTVVADTSGDVATTYVSGGTSSVTAYGTSNPPFDGSAVSGIFVDASAPGHITMNALSASFINLVAQLIGGVRPDSTHAGSLLIASLVGSDAQATGSAEGLEFSESTTVSAAGINSSVRATVQTLSALSSRIAVTGTMLAEARLVANAASSLVFEAASLSTVKSVSTISAVLAELAARASSVSAVGSYVGPDGSFTASAFSTVYLTTTASSSLVVHAAVKGTVLEIAISWLIRGVAEVTLSLSAPTEVSLEVPGSATISLTIRGLTDVV